MKSIARLRQKTRLLVKNGLLKKLPCEVCGELEVEAHHYDKRSATAVKWLCRKHHLEAHKLMKNKRGKRIKKRNAYVFTVKVNPEIFEAANNRRIELYLTWPEIINECLKSLSERGK